MFIFDCFGIPLIKVYPRITDFILSVWVIAELVLIPIATASRLAQLDQEAHLEARHKKYIFYLMLTILEIKKR